MITTEINRVSDRMTAVVMVRRIDDAGGLRTPSRQQAPLATATKATGEPGTSQIGINGMIKHAEDPDLRKCPVRNVRVLHSVVDLPPGGSFPLWNHR